MKNINKILNELGIRKYNLIDKSKGFDHKVYIVITEDKEFVIRIPIKEKNKIAIQAWAFQQWGKLKLPVPKILKITDDYLIEERIHGKDMSEKKLPLEQQQYIMYEVGKIAKKMHSIKTKKYGYLRGEGVAEKKEWAEFIEPDFRGNLNEVKKAKLLPNLLTKKIEKFFDDKKDILNFNDPRLLHQDLSYDNIIVNNGRLSGIIDASDAISGDPMHDIGIINQHNFGRNVMDSFFKGYGKVDIRKVNFYSLVHAIWLINLSGIISPNEKWFKKHIGSIKYFLTYQGKK